LLQRIAEVARNLMLRNDVVCAQEADGVQEILIKVAEEKKFEYCDCFKGIMTFWNPKSFTLVKHDLVEIWPKGSSEYAAWRRLVVCILKPKSSYLAQSSWFAICNNHCHVNKKKANTKLATIPKRSNLST